MRERDIFIEALQQSDPAQRAAHLDDACQGDASLRGQIEQLLAEHERQESFILDAPPAGFDGTALYHPIAEGPGTVIGPYKLLQQIGEGGMGVVFMAEQTDPIQRTVALKIIKPGMDTRQVIARFEAERQALAMMDHPNIARVLDAGTTDTGRPYFVMELVKGVPITKYCDEKHLSVRERLELMLPVCQAVQHAHQKGLIHRDIKPSNVLVAEYDDHAVPKVIDFGVAKATAQKLTDRTMFTEFGQVLGTVEYMSPEQAKLNQLDIDTRSDIYSLGVLLYELLTGSTPFGRKRLQSAVFDEMLRIIREEEPPKPSTRLSTAVELASIAASRGSEPKKLSGLVKGELDWIVMKALEKDRNRRYDTANGMAADVQRYLNDEPVEACPPSVSYRFRKLARRNKAAIWTAGLVAIAMCVGTVVSTWQAIRATHAEALAQTRLESEQAARQRATAEAAKATTISTMLQQMLGSANPDAAKGRDYTVRQMLDDFSKGLGDKLRNQPDAEADIHRTIGNAYRRLGSFDKAEMYLKSALELRVQLYGPEHAHVAESLVDFSWLLYDRGDFVGAETRAREALAIYRKLGLHNNKTFAALGALQSFLAWQLKYEEAEQLAHEALEMARHHPEQNLDVAAVLQHLAFAARQHGDLIKAEHFARQAVELHRKRDGEGPATVHGLIYLADSLLCQQKFDEAEDCYREALAIHRKHFDDSQPPVVEWLGLAETLRGKGDQAGLDALRATIDLSSTNTENENDWYYRGSLFVELGDWEQAEAAFVNGAKLEANSDTQLYSLFYLALARLTRNNQSGYRESCMSLVKQAEQSSEPNSALVAIVAVRACVLAPDSSGDPGQMVVLAQRAFESNSKEPKYLATLGAALYRADRFEDARKRFAEAIEAIPIGSSELHAVTYSHLFLAMIHQRLGQPEEARQWLNQAVQALDKPASLGQRRLAETWSRHVQLQILRKEAEAVLADGNGNRTTTNVTAPIE